MKQRWMMVVLMGAFLIPGWVGAVDKDDFFVDTTGDLMHLCTACESDPLHKEAVHFCMGFLVCSYHYHVVANMGPDGKRLVCPPDPPPPRAEVATRFVDWVKKHPSIWMKNPWIHCSGF